MPSHPGWLAALLALLLAGTALAQGPLDFQGAPPDELLVTWEPARPDAVSDTSRMINRVQGVAAVLDSGTRRRLAMLSRTAPQMGWPAELEPRGYLHAAQGDSTRLLAIARTADQIVLVRDLSPGGAGVCAGFEGDDLDALLVTLGAYGGPLRELAPEEILGAVHALEPPYRVSHIILDESTIRERIAGGRQTSLPPTERYLPDETLSVRLPLEYHPQAPAGLLVWVSASDDGQPPHVLEAAADGLGLILIGAGESGNRRLSTDRYQLALDAVATARERYHVDEARVYTAGLSGGGRICSALVACFPDVFTGAVPIVGLNLYVHTPLGDGRFVPAGFRKPRGGLWRLYQSRRIAPITGELDFNYREITNAVRIMQRDGLAVRLFEYEDMDHTLPTPERFTEAISWVDEPARVGRERAWAEAAEALERYQLKYGDVPVTTEAQRRMLAQVTVAGPWSPAAWKACELLGVAPAPEPAS